MATLLWLAVLWTVGLQECLSASVWALHGLSAALVAALVYLPVWRCDRAGTGLQALGLCWRGSGRALCAALAVATLVLPAYALGCHIVLSDGLLGFPPHPYSPSVAAAVASLAGLPVQVLGVALPEEIFFRGYLQPQLGLGPANVCFALTHLAGPQRLMGLWTFFPGLLFGWLRRRGTNLVGAVCLHALCNVFADLWLRQYPG